MKNKKIWILSEKALFREALKSLLNNESNDFDTLCFPMNEVNMLENILLYSPEILLIDVNGSVLNVWEFMKKINSYNILSKTLIISDSNEDVYVNLAKKFGASGFISKSSSKELFLSVLHVISNNGHFFESSAQVTKKIGNVEHIQEKYNLSTRELEIILLIKDGLSSKDTASVLGISFHTVEAHRKNIYNKLQINKVTELLKILAEHEE